MTTAGWSATEPAIVELIVKNRGYTWIASFGGKQKTGTVKFKDSTARAFNRLIECVSACGG